MSANFGPFRYLAFFSSYRTRFGLAAARGRGPTYGTRVTWRENPSYVGALMDFIAQLAVVSRQSGTSLS